MKPRVAPYLWCLAVLVGALALRVFTGDVPIAPAEILRILLSKLSLTTAAPDWPHSSETIILSVRLPGALLMALAGAALGGSGAAYQGLLRNPLADPYLIGVAPGAGLGAVIAMVWAWPGSLLGLAVIPTFAFLGAIGTIACVYSLARVGKTTPVTTLILAGVAVGSFASALTSFLMLATQREIRRVLYFILGGFSLGGWSPVLAALPYVVLGLSVLVLLARPLNVLQFGDDQARQMGLDVERMKLVLVLGASLAAASAVAFCGIIGFVGLVVPHLMRLLWGPDYRRLIPLSILAGAAALLLADSAASIVVSISSAPAASAFRQLPVGVITAFLGAPFFLLLLRRVRQSYW
jgi:iron complex transport system permease protein